MDLLQPTAFKTVSFRPISAFHDRLKPTHICPIGVLSESAESSQSTNGGQLSHRQVRGEP